MSEITFLVEPDAKGDYTACALEYSVFAEADTLEELRQAVQHATRCHFEDERPTMVRLHMVQDEVMPVRICRLTGMERPWPDRSGGTAKVTRQAGSHMRLMWSARSNAIGDAKAYHFTRSSVEQQTSLEAVSRLVHTPPADSPPPLPLA